MVEEFRNRIKEPEVIILSHQSEDAGDHFNTFIDKLRAKYPQEDLKVEKISSNRDYEAKVGGETVGVLAGFKDGDGLMAQRLIVDPAYRNRRIATSLIESAKQDFLKITLRPGLLGGTNLDHNGVEQLVKMYEGWGFRNINDLGVMVWTRDANADKNNNNMEKGKHWIERDTIQPQAFRAVKELRESIVQGLRKRGLDDNDAFLAVYEPVNEYVARMKGNYPDYNEVQAYHALIGSGFTPEAYTKGDFPDGDSALEFLKDLEKKLLQSENV